MSNVVKMPNQQSPQQQSEQRAADQNQRLWDAIKSSDHRAVEQMLGIKFR